MGIMSLSNYSDLILDYKLILILLIFAAVLNWLTKNNQKIFNENHLPKNMTFHRCPSIHLESQNNNLDDPRALTVILTWLLAKDKHLVKYKQLWLKRGFDVLIVKNSPKDILLPPIGSHILARNVIKVIANLKPEYNEVVVHAFCIGGYLFGEVLVQLFEKSPQLYPTLPKLIKGVIYDSPLRPCDGPSGMSKVVASNPKMQLLIENLLIVYFKLFNCISNKHHVNSEQMVINFPLKCPELFLYSRADIITNYKSVEDFVEKSIQMGNEIWMKCWDESGHLLHYKHHQKEYEQELDSFLKYLNLKNINI